MMKMMEMVNQEAKYYSCDAEVGEGLRMYERLRERSLFFDVTIVTEDKVEIPAHRFALGVRFPALVRSLSKEANGRVLWERFSADIVEQALSYVYKGSIEVTPENALRLFLLGKNLRCKDIQNWCLEYLKTWIKPENIVEAWKVAQTTRDEILFGYCLGALRKDFASLVERQAFVDATEAFAVARIFVDPTIQTMRRENAAESTSLVQDFLLEWLYSPRSLDANKSERSRMEDLLQILNPAALNEDHLHWLINTAINLNVSSEYRKLLLAAKTESLSCENPAFSNGRRKNLLILESKVDPPMDTQSQYANSYSSNNGKWIVHSFDVFEGICNSKIEIPTADVGIRAAVAFKNYICFFGSKDFVIYNRKSKNLFPCPDRPYDLDPFAAVPTNGMIIFLKTSRVIGRLKSTYRLSSYAFVWEARKWITLPQIDWSDSTASVLAVPGSGVFVCQGDDARLLRCDLEGNANQQWEWQKLPNMNRKRYHPALAYFNETIFAAGGTSKDTFDVECLQKRSNTFVNSQWTIVSISETPEAGPHELIVSDDELFLFCGHKELKQYCPPRVANTAWVTNAWKLVADLEWPFKDYHRVLTE